MNLTRDKDEILVKLFGSVARGRILKLLFSITGKSFYQREIMFEAGLSLQTKQRELNNLLNLNIIKRNKNRNIVYYEVNILSPFFKPLLELIENAQK